MQLMLFSRDGWESWCLPHEPLIDEGMPFLIDDDLLFEDDAGPRPTVAANQWLRQLPISGVRSARSWLTYAQALRSCFAFLQSRGTHPYGDKESLRAVLGAFAEYRLSGPMKARWDGATWNQRPASTSGQSGKGTARKSRSRTSWAPGTPRPDRCP
ncbi:hypothetical protein [Streptomyces sp. NPDC058155]|uniref:hypothetical protein n=1 Tax=Streptomyces sp. NPDC058155 TaxID=3346359 RepID=UPI0036E63669